MPGRAGRDDQQRPLVTPNVTAQPVQALTGRPVLVVDAIFVLAFAALPCSP